MKDYIVNTGKEFKLRVYDTQDFVLFYILDPNVKLYYVQYDDDTIHCVQGKNYAHLFTSRNSALDVSEVLKKKFNIVFNIESYI